MFEVRNVDVKISTRYLLRSLSFTLNKGDKLAVIGEEGNGKSTLLKALLGICSYATISGTISFKGNTVGYLEQAMSEEKQKKKVYDFLFKDSFDYYNKVNKLYKYLENLDIEDSILEKKIYHLSGGERVKIQILNLLLEEYDILFLDEPTNDLDIQTLKWLENFMKNIDKPILYVSHDETLLSHTANMILHLEQIKKKQECKHTLVRSDYVSYTENRLRKIENQTQISRFEKRRYQQKQERLQQIMQKVEYQQNTITRRDPHGAKVLKKKMHSLKVQEKKLENMNLTEAPDLEEQIFFSFSNVEIPKNKKIVQIDIQKLIVENKVLSKDIHFEVVGKQHVCIIGKNGIGKTTLLKKIYETLKSRTDIKVGYMPQVYEDIFQGYTTVFDFFSSLTQEELTRIRMYLGNMNFTKEEMTGKIQDLSNGTKAKLFFIKFVFEQCDVLLLDEPTRNVSPLSGPIIRKVLKDFQGTIVSISHDRKYIEEVIDTLYLFDEKGITKIDKKNI